jgi:predicted RNase H-like nuclease
VSESAAGRQYFGIDLAWGEGSAAKPANETGLVHIDGAGRVVNAGWARGIREVADWVLQLAKPGDVIGVDAPLVVYNATGMRECEREVGQRYGRWKVSANASNLGMAALGGVTLRRLLEDGGFTYVDGTRPPAADEISFFECYPHTTLVGASELGYELERPRYKRMNLALPIPERRAARAVACDELIRRMALLSTAEPSLDLRSHEVTAMLVDEASPLTDREYKHREDLLDGALCAWTAALWAGFGDERCQVLGLGAAPDEGGRRPTLIAAARAEQRRP